MWIILGTNFQARPRERRAGPQPGDDPLEGWTEELMDEKEVWEGLEPALEGEAVSLSFPTVHARYLQSPSL